MRSVLIADDDEILVELVRLQLEAAGYEVEVARDGERALEAVRDVRPDAVILDAMMPVMNGQEVLRALRADPAFAELPVMMLTARKGQEDIVTFLSSGANEYLTKPFIPQELLLRLEMMLRNALRKTG